MGFKVAAYPLALFQCKPTVAVNENFQFVPWQQMKIDQKTVLKMFLLKFCSEQFVYLFFDKKCVHSLKVKEGTFVPSARWILFAGQK